MNFPNTVLLGMQKQSYAEIDFSEKKPVVSEEVVRLSKKEKKWVWGIGGVVVILSIVLTIGEAFTVGHYYYVDRSYDFVFQDDYIYNYGTQIEALNGKKFRPFHPVSEYLYKGMPPNWFALRGIPDRSRYIFPYLPCVIPNWVELEGIPDRSEMRFVIP